MRMMAQCLMLLESDPDREWFSQVYRENFRRMSALAVRLLGPGPKAEDAVHDAFLKLIHHSEQLRDWESGADRGMAGCGGEEYGTGHAAP